MNKIRELEILSNEVLKTINGGGAAEMVGLGIAQTLVITYAGFFCVLGFL